MSADEVFAAARCPRTIKVGDELTLPDGRIARVTQVCSPSAVYAGVVQDDNTVRDDMRIDERAWIRRSIAQGRY